MALLIVEENRLIDTRNVSFVELWTEGEIGYIVAAFPLSGKAIPNPFKGELTQTFKDIVLFTGSIPESRKVFNDIQSNWFKEIPYVVPVSTKTLPIINQQSPD